MTENVDSVSPASPKPRAPKPPTELRRGSSSAPNPKTVLPKIPDFQSSDPVEANPFPAADQRHEVWRRATLTAEEELHRLNSHFFQGAPTGDMVEFDARSIGRTVAIFEIWAKRGIQVVWDDRDLRNYDDWLSSYANAWLKDFEPRLRNHLPVFGIELHRSLLSRVEYWRAEGRRYLAEQEKQVGDTQPKTTDPQSIEQSRTAPVATTQVQPLTADATLVKPATSSVTSRLAAKRMVAYIESNGLSQTQFAIKAGTTDRTIRSFREKGKVRRGILESIANAMGVSKEELLKPE